MAVAKMYTALYGRMVVTQDLEVHAIQYDSRKVERGDLFVAIRGESLDGHRFIDQAVSRGAGVVVVEDDDMVPDSFFQHAGVMKILVHDSRATLAGLAKNFYEDPSRRLRLLGVTGTNG